MLRSLESIEAEALLLTPDERIALAERLIASLPTDPDIDAAWDVEIERRLAEIDSGAVTLLPGPETLEQLKAEFS